MRAPSKAVTSQEHQYSPLRRFSVKRLLQTSMGGHSEGLIEPLGVLEDHARDVLGEPVPPANELALDETGYPRKVIE
eukprot:6079619-Pyramimonas_sp.AAC.1